VTIAIPPALPLSLPDETIVACNQTSTLLDAGSGGSSYLWSTGATSQTITVNAPGTYSVTVSNGCAKTDQTNVIMPHADIVQANQDICTGGNLTLSLATPVHGSILWSTGETTTSISVTTAGAYSGR
jgi:Tfp pilus assembly protein PilX